MKQVCMSAAGSAIRARAQGITRRPGGIATRLIGLAIALVSVAGAIPISPPAMKWGESYSCTGGVCFVWIDNIPYASDGTIVDGINWGALPFPLIAEASAGEPSHLRPFDPPLDQFESPAPLADPAISPEPNFSGLIGLGLIAIWLLRRRYSTQVR